MCCDRHTVHLIGVEYLVVACDVQVYVRVVCMCVCVCVCACVCVCVCMCVCGGECDCGYTCANDSFHPAPADPEYGCPCLQQGLGVTAAPHRHYTCHADTL